MIKRALPSSQTYAMISLSHNYRHIQSTAEPEVRPGNFSVPAPNARGVIQVKVSLWSATHISSPSSYEILLRLWYESNDVTSPCTETMCEHKASPPWHLLMSILFRSSTY